MPGRLHLSRISASLADQAVVSGGTFVVNLLLARSLPPAEYGVFALLFGGMLTLQLFNAALLFHPLSVRLVVTGRDDQPRLLGASLVLIVLLSVVLAAALAVVLAMFGRADLLLPALACFLLWQLQEGLRRGLLSSFRHRAAIPGDALSYLGQAAVILALALGDVLTLAAALYGMAATSALAAIVQLRQLGPRLGGGLRLRETAADYWSIGGLWSLGNGLLLHGRTQALLWGLAATSGAAAAASFQAASNIVSVTNPILLALYNIIPQTASHASAKGHAEAWRAARVYVLLAMPPILAYSAIVLAAPELVLRIFYGAGSGYLELSLAVRLVVVAWLLSYTADVVASFLHGVKEVPLAFSITAAGAAATVLLAVPLIGTLGVIGNCLTHVGANAVRLVAARHVLARVLGRPRALPVPSAA